MRGVTSSVDTVNAAASAIISAESRVQQVTVPGRRWGAWLSFYWCFGSQKHTKRINHAVLLPEPTSSTSEPPVSQNLNRPQTLTLPFIAPPSSPASFLNSEPPSSAQSPGGFLSLATGPSSIFAIGPYANETQLVSPPVFSTFTTEPNTAPFTPPPESVQITTPSSPEVPFAQLLSSSFESNCKKGDPRGFQTYQWYPESPVDSSRRHSSILDGQISAIVIPKDDEPVVAVDHRVSFELTAEDVARCMEKKVAGKGEIRNGELVERIESSGELVAGKEFKFSNSEGSGTAKTMPPKNWAFFPMVQSGVIS